MDSRRISRLSDGRVLELHTEEGAGRTDNPEYRGAANLDSIFRDHLRARAEEVRLRDEILELRKEGESAVNAFVTAQGQRDAERVEKERLQAEVGRLQAALGAVVQLEADLAAERAEAIRLRLDVEAERARTEMVEQTRDGLLEERARLREALKPFAAQAQLLDGYEGSAPDLLVQMGITADDCKRAAEALGQPQAQENTKPPEQPGQALCLWCGEALPLRTPETSGRIVEHLERCSKHPMRELEQTSRQMAKAIAEADAALGEFASHHPRKDGFHPFPRCVEEAVGTLRGRIADLEADGARFREALGGLGVAGGGYCWCATQEQAAAGHAGECRGAAMAMGMTELRNNLWTIAAPVEGGQ